MCGIVGMVSSNKAGFYNAHQKIFKDMLWADAVRGDDSTGVFGVNKYGNVDFLKEKGSPAELFKTKEWDDFESDIFSQFHMVVGHNRKATRGATTDENAHPFVEGNTILVHNGTLFNHSSLTEKKVEVDSHAILHSIVERGYEKTIEELDGAFTLVWYDTKEKELYIIRNEQRPLFIANTEGAWFFASEEKMLKWCISREEVKIADITNCKPGTLYTFNLEDKETMWYKPLKLKKTYQQQQSSQQNTTAPHTTFSPPTIYVSPTKIGGKSDEEKKSDSNASENDVVYQNTDFPIGTRILVVAKEIRKLKRDTDNKTHVILGNWFFDMTVTVRCLATLEDINKIDTELDDTSSEAIFACDIASIVTNVTQRKVTLGCKDPIPYVAKYDMEGREIMEDEFIFSDKTCSYCGTVVEFDSLQKGIFKYNNPTDNEICCEHCFDRGAHKV